tara:strand:+ start:1508 stop:1924 length:417 start_codon:yes stop_codon:yes gene_type:complete
MALREISGVDYKKSRTFKDIPMNFFKNSFTKDISVVKNAEAIKQSVRNIVLTSPGEKLFDPTFGSRIYTMLFEPLDAFLIDALSVEILNTVKNYEKRVTVTDLKCKADYDNNAVDVTLEYKIIGIPVTETIQFVLQRP